MSDTKSNLHHDARVPRLDEPCATLVIEQGLPIQGKAAADSPSLLRSVSANWLWCGVVAVSGFILPRLIDRHEGQALLGVWDFGWSLVVYISFLAFGVTSAINRYVARHRAENDWTALNEVVNASLVWLCGACGVGLLLAVVFAWLVPVMLDELSGQMLLTARLVVLILAVKCALQVPMSAFSGIITGYERFDLLNAIRIVRDLGAVLLMAALLFRGYGLVALALCLLITELLGDAVKLVLARRLCPTLRLGPGYASRTALRAVLGFGLKTFLQGLARGGVYQGSSLLVGIYLGPAALAVYARQRSLVMHLTRFVQQYAQVFVPRSSAMQAAGDDAALRGLLIKSSRYGLYVTLPPVLIVTVLGNALLEVWMGPGYRTPWVLIAMALGHLVFLPQMGVYSVLMGLGRHGVPAAIEIAAAVVSVTAGIVLLQFFDGELLAAALAMSLPLAVASGIVLPVYACRLVGLSFAAYVRSAVPGPLLVNLPLFIVLILAHQSLAHNSVALLWVGGGLGSLVTAVIYVAFVAPAHLRQRLADVLRRATWTVPRREEVRNDTA